MDITVRARVGGVLCDTTAARPLAHGHWRASAEGDGTVEVWLFRDGATRFMVETSGAALRVQALDDRLSRVVYEACQTHLVKRRKAFAPRKTPAKT